jgi:hypothetical protein
MLLKIIHPVAVADLRIDRRVNVKAVPTGNAEISALIGRGFPPHQPSVSGNEPIRWIKRAHLAPPQGTPKPEG